MHILIFRKLKSDNEGFALPVVLIALVVLSIILISLAALAANNTRQTIAQESNLKAHYLARSGVEIAYGALMTTEGGVQKLYDTFKDGEENSNTVLTEEIKDLKGGTVYITVQRNGDWVTIYAKGVLDDGNGQAVIYLDIDVIEPTFVIWRN